MPLARLVSAASRGFRLIAEPRYIRLLLFAVYAVQLYAGIALLVAPPESFLRVLGPAMMSIFASFVTAGSALSLIAVLPGVWWLERAGIFALAIGLSMYWVVSVTLDSSVLNSATTIALVGMFVTRWMMIQKSDLAPLNFQRA